MIINQEPILFQKTYIVFQLVGHIFYELVTKEEDYASTALLPTKKSRHRRLEML